MKHGRTSVGIVGGGPAGLMLSHLLHVAGIESVVDRRRAPGDEIEQTIRAGILERDSVRLLVETGRVRPRAARRPRARGHRAARSAASSHRIDFQGLVGRVGLALPADRGVHRPRRTPARATAATCGSASTDTAVVDVTSDQPGMRFTDADGAEHEMRCDVPGRRRRVAQHLPPAIPAVGAPRSTSGEYPFAWFGILCEAPPSAPELIYTHSDRGFALISQRTETGAADVLPVRRPTRTVDDWSEDRIWAELQARVGRRDGFTLKEGPIFEQDGAAVPQLTSCEPMRYGNLLLAGDAAHTVPPTGAKGLNLALADVRVLAEVLERAVLKNDSRRPRRLHRHARWTGCGRRSTSRTG